MKSQLSSLEVAALVNEFQILIDGKIDQVYQSEKKEFVFSLHIPRKGKNFLKIKLPNFIFLSQQKTEMPPPSEFCLTLRRNLNNSIIKKIQQIHSERIIEITLQKEFEFKLIIELFSKGNLILTDQKDNIITVLEKQRWETREIRPKEIYLPPPASFNYFKTSLKDLKQKITGSQKNRLITCLAAEIGLGGIYAEEICLLNTLNKNQLPKETTDLQIKSIYQTIKDFLKQIEKPKGFIYDLKDITPLPLKIYQNLNQKEFPAFYQALNEVLDKQALQIEKEKKQSQYQEKIKKLKHIIQEQEDTIEKLKEQEQSATKKANHIYEKYQELNIFLNKIKQAKKNISWEQIKQEIKKNPKIKNINLKEKKILLEI